MEVYMKKDVLIKYLPYGTTQEEIKKIRHEFKDEDTTLILMISGKEKLLDCLETLINID
jgi:Glu-tRNA(Gln) amidotransferase subunit E-like FAD-binding protein